MHVNLIWLQNTSFIGLLNGVHARLNTKDEMSATVSNLTTHSHDNILHTHTTVVIVNEHYLPFVCTK